MCLRCGVTLLRHPGHVEGVMKKRLRVIDRDIVGRCSTLSGNELDDLQVERENCFLVMAQAWGVLGFDLVLWSDQRARAPWNEEQIV